MSSTESERPVCLVTGGTSGVGNATVHRFADEGYRIATCGRNLDRLNQLKNEVLADQNQNLVAEVDLTQIDATIDFGQSVLRKFGRVDVLINNAAAAPLGPFAEISKETFENTLDSNIRSVFYLTQLIWRHMSEQGRGVIINISSLASIDPFPGFSIYGASKAWIDLMTQALASEGNELGIRVCSIRAGAVETPMLRGLFPDFPAEQCVSAETIADTLYDCVQNPDRFPSGQHFPVTNQP